MDVSPNFEETNIGSLRIVWPLKGAALPCWSKKRFIRGVTKCLK